jgi:hypothetical protein
MKFKEMSIKQIIFYTAIIILCVFIGKEYIKGFSTSLKKEPKKADSKRSASYEKYMKPSVITSKDGNKVYVYWGQYESIKKDEILDGDILAIGANLHISGTIKGSIVHIGGSLDLEKDAVVEKNITLIYGSFTNKENAKISGNVTKIGESEYLATSLFFTGISLRMITSFTFNYGSGFPALLVMLFLKKRVLKIADAVTSLPGKSILWGLGGFASFLFLSVLVMIPMFFKNTNMMILFLLLWAAFIAIFVLLLAYAKASVAYLIGQKMEDAGWLGKREFIIKGIIGLFVISLILYGINAIPVIGWYLSFMLLMAIRIAGAGATLRTWFIKEELPQQE